ncbi:MAG: 1,4-dihydroxy-2-naphthoate octaprenyltransferase [Dehalococcoidia bacterium]|nr:1,4-dihydroxy-2-naphthoate octaprenyltransferase [Dehalococcoidia bacterium]
MTSAKTWFQASRPFSFTAAVVPSLVGSLLSADQTFSLWKAVLAILGSVFFLAGTNFVNDFYDHRKGADGPESLGMAGFIQRGLLSPKSVLVAGFACFAAGAGIGIVLCLASGWELFFIGVASALAGFLYTGWPLHLAYIGLGEIVVFLFMGPIIVMGASFVQVEEFTWQAFAASLPIAFLVAAILHANNLRDIEVDRKAQKRTVATVIGRKWANREMYLLLGLTYVALVGAWAVGALPWPALVALASLPLVRPIAAIVHAGGNPKKLNLVLYKTAQLHMRFGALMAAGLGLNWLIESL